MGIAEWIVNVFTVYAALGLVFAVAFVAWGAAKLDAAARDSGIGFQLMILPGAAALWPALLVRWIRAGAHWT